MKFYKIFSLFLVTAFVLQAGSSFGQTAPVKHRIAIFAPLYLDSAFDAQQNYRYLHTSFPKFINPGLDFYEGAQLCLDSLAKEGLPLEVFVYDTRSATESLEQQLAKAEKDEVELIIANCSGNEVRHFAEAGLRKNIPVINCSAPNDGGSTSNPFFVILNSTLKTQCEGLYKFIQKNYSLDPIVVFRKKGSNEDLIKSYFDEYGKTTMGVPLKMKYVDLTDSFTVSQLRVHLDSNSKMVCIAGTLDVNFGNRLALELASISKQYSSALIGMPTWDVIKDFAKPDYKGIEIIYSTPFYNSKTDKVSQSINTYFNSKMYAHPSDMVFRGYEVTWKFAHLLVTYGKDLASNLASKQNKLFTDFDIQPVINRKNTTLDYFENKKLYFIKWQDGMIKGVY